jgi:hypothetical protein
VPEWLRIKVEDIVFRFHITGPSVRQSIRNFFGGYNAMSGKSTLPGGGKRLGWREPSDPVYREGSTILTGRNLNTNSKQHPGSAGSDNTRQRLAVDGYERGPDETVADFLRRLPPESKRKIRDALM